MKEIEKQIKKCPIHGETEFALYISGKKKQWKCKKCDSEASTLNSQLYKLKAIKYKGEKCEICGYNKNIAALEFHHIDPTQKDFTITKTKKKWDIAKQELDKCILVCANCHRELHYPHANYESLKQMEDNHKEIIKLKEKIRKHGPNKYKFTLEEVNEKYSELNNWKLVAEFYEISLATLKRHRCELEMLKRSK